MVARSARGPLRGGGMNATAQFPTVLDAALDYARRGWPVFPVPVGTKKSHKSAEHSGGRKWGATCDLNQIAADFRKWPDANVGIVTGPASGILVIEADTLDGHDVDGIANLEALVMAHGGLPATIEALSPSGSRHLYFRYPAGRNIRNSAGKIAPGIDVRGDGGMVLAAPSIKPGKSKPYTWTNPPGLFALADCPEWLLRLCEKPDPKQAGGLDFNIDTGQASAWANAAIAGELARLFSATTGDRNETLNKAAFALGQIAGGGNADPEDMRRRLIGAGLSIGLDQVEVEDTVASGLEAGLQSPRGPKDQATGEAHTGAAGEAGTPDHTHDQLALDLGRDLWDQDAKHVAAWGAWLIWTGAQWRKDTKLAHLTQAREYLRHRADDLTKWATLKADEEAKGGDDKAAKQVTDWAASEAKRLRDKHTVAAVVDMARSNPASGAGPDDFDRNTMIIGTPTGTIDIKAGYARPATRGDMITKLTGVGMEDGKPVEWLHFLDMIFDGDREVIGFLRRALGYTLTGETTEHKLFFCHGSGANGKSTLLNTVSYILGDYSRRAAAETFLAKQSDSHPTDVAGLRGARFIAASEIPRGRSWNEATIKDLTGGDVMTARFMRGDYFDFKPEGKLWIAGNTMPSFRGVDEAMRRRVVLIPFRVTIPADQRDTRLPAKLEAEAGKILSWIVAGAVEWQARGLMVPASIAAAATEYLDDEDVLGQFLAEETALDTDAFVTTGDLHQRFKQWADIQGLASWTMRTLQKEVAARGFATARRGKGNGFTGLKLGGLL